MKRNNRKLSLQRETLQALDRRQLAGVGGGTIILQVTQLCYAWSVNYCQVPLPQTDPSQWFTDCNCLGG